MFKDDLLKLLKRYTQELQQLSKSKVKGRKQSLARIRQSKKLKLRKQKVNILLKLNDPSNFSNIVCYLIACDIVGLYIIKEKIRYSLKEIKNKDLYL